MEAPKVDPHQRLLVLFSKTLVPALATVFVLLIIGITIMLLVGTTSTVDRLFVISIMQVGIACIVGFASLFIGTVMCWFGISGSLSVGAEGPGAKLGVQSTQIGAVLLVGGLVMIGFALYKPISFREIESRPIRVDSSPIPTGVPRSD